MQVALKLIVAQPGDVQYTDAGQGDLPFLSTMSANQGRFFPPPLSATRLPDPAYSQPELEHGPLEQRLLELRQTIAGHTPEADVRFRPQQTAGNGTRGQWPNKAHWCRNWCLNWRDGRAGAMGACLLLQIGAHSGRGAARHSLRVLRQSLGRTGSIQSAWLRTDWPSQNVHDNRTKKKQLVSHKWSGFYH